MEYSFTIGAVALAPEDHAPAVIAAMDAHMHDGVNEDGWQDVSPLEPGAGNSLSDLSMTPSPGAMVSSNPAGLMTSQRRTTAQYLTADDSTHMR